MNKIQIAIKWLDAVIFNLEVLRVNVSVITIEIGTQDNNAPYRTIIMSTY